jgi:hypothetical protein
VTGCCSRGSDRQSYNLGVKVMLQPFLQIGKIVSNMLFFKQIQIYQQQMKYVHILGALGLLAT